MKRVYETNKIQFESITQEMFLAKMQISYVEHNNVLFF